ncbi:hypothetical protein [Thermomonospora umbrina]|uniref:Uncharacterized protein n=1 Tax=Thermomonospora umbrina TaxID=111806 RepID=A0A3D9SXF5_9ACTN|nr:hypothetical protein [Thermomonospora umbrina]REF00248.1 hypothetical protein DFJ69_5776 [Thermomonospora umbrina]
MTDVPTPDEIRARLHRDIEAEIRLTWATASRPARGMLEAVVCAAQRIVDEITVQRDLAQAERDRLAEQLAEMTALRDNANLDVSRLYVEVERVRALAEDGPDLIPSREILAALREQPTDRHANRVEAEAGALRERLAASEAHVAAVRAVHRPISVTRVRSCDTHGSATVCSGCQQYEALTCAALGCFVWPCATITALDGPAGGEGR